LHTILTGNYSWLQPASLLHLEAVPWYEDRRVIMYLDLYIAVPLWIFAIFGFLYFLLRVFVSLDLYKRQKQGVYTLLISAKNQEDIIEGVVRGFILKAGMDSSEEKLMQIVLLDTGSADNTPKIMENLAYDYSVIKIVKPDNLAEYLKTLA